MMDISMSASAKLSEHSTNIILNDKLWKRVKAVYDGRDKLTLSPEDKTLLERTYESFAFSGANLEGKDRETFRTLNSSLSALTTRFGQNVLKELNTYGLHPKTLQASRKAQSKQLLWPQKKKDAMANTSSRSPNLHTWRS